MKKKPTPPLERHANCQVEIRTSKYLKHFAVVFCTDCNKHVQWLSKKDAIVADKLGLIKE